MKYIMIGVDLGERRADGAIEALFSTSQVNPRVDDRRVLRRIIVINRNELRWRDAREITDLTRRSIADGSAGATPYTAARPWYPLPQVAAPDRTLFREGQEIQRHRDALRQDKLQLCDKLEPRRSHHHITMIVQQSLVCSLLTRAQVAGRVLPSGQCNYGERHRNPPTCPTLSGPASSALFGIRHARFPT